MPPGAALGAAPGAALGAAPGAALGAALGAAPGAGSSAGVSGIMTVMRNDGLGNSLSDERDDTVAAIVDFVDGFLAYESRAEKIIAAADADRNSCLANTYAGFLWMFLEAPEAAGHARGYLDAAEACGSHATPRERLNVAVLRAWAQEDVAAAIALCDRISDEHPQDLISVKLLHYFQFNRGNSPEMLRVALKVLPYNLDVPYMHGMAAFAYEQCHLLDEAQAAAQRALDLKRKEPWAQHALAHVLLTRGRIEEGAAFLEGEVSSWTGLNSFMSTHLWWHLALFYLSQGREQEVLRIYDGYCWGIAKQYSQDQIGAVSLLARMELAGIDVGARWEALGEYLAPRARDTVQPFLTLQYLYGLARAGRPEAESLLAAVREAARDAPPFVREVWREVALPASEGMLAHARGRFEEAWFKLGAALPRLIEAGGSHAQRDLFEQLQLDAAIRSGRYVSAQQTLELRRTTDVMGVPVNTALADVYDRLRLNELAAAARRRAAQTLSRVGAASAVGAAARESPHDA